MELEGHKTFFFSVILHDFQTTNDFIIFDIIFNDFLWKFFSSDPLPSLCCVSMTILQTENAICSTRLYSKSAMSMKAITQNIEEHSEGEKNYNVEKKNSQRIYNHWQWDWIVNWKHLLLKITETRLKLGAAVMILATHIIISSPDCFICHLVQ